jgi:hypothetical protein
MSKPLTGAVLGVLIGIATAIFLARQGIWPPDQLTVFFLPGILGLLGMLLLSMGRPSKGPFTLVVALLILVPMLLWGALGFGSFSEQGQLNGGCTVQGSSDVDSTTVTDTSRANPFVIDPDGGLTWEATSPSVFQDYDWELTAFIGGIPITIESAHEANTNGDEENGGEVDDIRAYADTRGIDLDLYRGVYKVGGSAGSCDGFGFVEITGDGMDTIALIALIVAITLLIVLIVLMFTGREVVVATTESEEVVVIEDEAPGGVDSDPNRLDGDSSDL